MGVFTVGVAVSLVGVGQVALWFDEAATVAAAERPIAGIFDLVQNVDAVHTVYYLFMHWWIEVFGASPLSLRIPSALAVGATGLVVVRFVTSAAGGADKGFVAGLVTVCLPRMYWAGSEARQFSFTALLAALLVWATWSAWNRRGWQPWVPVVVLIALSIYVFLFDALVVLALVAAALVLRKPFRATVLAVGLGIVTAIPLLAVSTGQTGQVGWVERPTVGYLLRNAAFTAWFDGQWRPLNWTAPAWAGVVGKVLAVAFVVLLVAAIARCRVRVDRNLVVVAVCWAAVPAAVLGIASLLATPVYVPRYLTMTAPALGIVAALGIHAITSKASVRSLGVAVLVAVCLLPQAYLKDFTPHAGDFSTMATSVAQSREWSSDIIFEDDQARAARFAYSEYFVDMNDLGLESSPVDSATLFGRTLSVSPEELARGRKIIFVEDPSQGTAGEAYGQLARACDRAEVLPDGDPMVNLFDCTRDGALRRSGLF